MNKSAMSKTIGYPVWNGGRSPSGYSPAWNYEGTNIIMSEGGNSCGFLNLIEGPFWCGGHCYVMKPNELCDVRFMYQLLKYHESQIMKLRVGSGLPNIQKSALLAFEVEQLPSLSVQKKIAAVLSDLDALIEAQETLIVKKKDIKAATMELLLTGEKRLPGFSDTWLSDKMKNVLLRNPSYGINAAACEYNDSLYSYCRITDIDDNFRYTAENKVSVKNALAETYLLNDGDIVIARTGASVGKSCLYTTTYGPLVYAGFLIKVVTNPNILLPKYLSLIFQTHDYWTWLHENSMRSGQPGINAEQLASYMLKIPSIEEQRSISEIITNQEDDITFLTEELKKQKNQKAATMHKLLTGEIRLT